MRYELLLQAAEPGARYEADGVRQALAARDAKWNADGSGVLHLARGSVDLRPLREGGVEVATEMHIRLMDTDALAREVVALAVDVARAAHVRLVDPQLSREVTSPQDGAVNDQYLKTARYAGEMAGVSAAIAVPAADPGLKPGTKVMLAVIGAALLLLFLADHLIR